MSKNKRRLSKMVLGVFGVVLQILMRIHSLLGKEGVALLAD